VAEVKLKNGYLRISVSLFENLYFRNFSKHELQIISLIVRLSYGYQKKTAYIKPKNWFSVCGIPRQDIFKTIRGLTTKNVIKNLGNNTYSLNKNFDEWLVNFPKTYDEEKLNMFLKPFKAVFSSLKFIFRNFLSSLGLYFIICTIYFIMQLIKAFTMRNEIIQLIILFILIYL